MKLKDWIILGFILGLYLLSLFLFKREIFSFKFDKTLLNRYFVSQDIPQEVKGRLFLSDGEVYLATGYLYATGSDPAQFNFEHPPLIKYLFGLSVLLFNNPYVVQMLFGMLVLSLTYFLGLKMYKNRIISFSACLLLVIDPLFLDVSSQPLLDMGQAVFMLLYTLAIFYYPNNFIFQGVALALFAGTKFWVTPLFFVGLFAVFNFYKKKLNLKNFILHLFVALCVYSLFYLKTFIDIGGNFNILFFLLKVLKYRLVHNASSFFGSSFLLFTTGFFKSWWGKEGFLIGNIWFVLWPISLIVNTAQGALDVVKKKISIQTLVALIPLSYLIFLGVQAPFQRYFLIILPFSYLTLSKWFFSVLVEMPRIERGSGETLIKKFS